MRPTCFATWMLSFLLCLATVIRAQDTKPSDSINRDYAAELPRIPAKSPAEAQKTFQVAKGFRIELVAAEPLVNSPVALSFDENGRLYVVEMRGYSENDADRISRIRVLDDTDGDGRYDKSSIFVSGLAWPTAICCYDGGVFVADAPDVFFFRDTDGDDHADQRTVVMTGFGRSNVQGLVNSFQWGLDHRIHGATSSAGAELVVPSKKDGDKAIALRGRDFSFDPRTIDIQITSGGAQHGMSFNQWGDKFVCSNSDHIQHVVFEDRYVARNPYFAAPGPRRSIAVDGPQAEVFRTSPVEPWRIVRTRLRVQGIVPGVVEGGGRAAGYFTGATGVTIYRGNAWPAEYVGWALVGDVGGNLVHRKRLDADGVSFQAHRVDEKSEFVSSSDIWFRPCQFANAPDGSMWVLDVYREVIEHPASLPPIIKKHLDLTSGRDMGRLYRIVPDNFQQPTPPRLGKATTAELVQTLAHRNGWHRDTAARLLYQRQDKSATKLLARQAAESELAEGRIASLYALDGLQTLTPDDLLKALSDSHPRVREHAVRLSEGALVDSADIREKLLTMQNDPELRVRYQLAFTLGEMSGARRNQALAAIARQNPVNADLRVAVMSSVNEGAGEVLALLTSDKEFRSSAAGTDWIRALCAQIGKQQRSEDVAAVLTMLNSLRDDSKSVQTIVQALALKKDSSFDRQIASATGGESERVMREMLDNATRMAKSTATLKKRVDAVQMLRLGTFAQSKELLASLLQPSEPSEIQAAAVGTLGAFTDGEVGQLLVQAWPTLSPRLRSSAADILGSRDVWLAILLRGVAAGEIPSSDLDAARFQLYAASKDEKIRDLVKQVGNRNQLASRADVLMAYRNVLQMQGDATRGKALFGKICATCHQFGGTGFAIGPNLAAMRNRGPDAILTNVLAPNQEVNPQYVNYVVVTKDGRQLTGIIAAETATSVTLRRAENQSDTVLRIDIEELRGTGVSLMPEGMEKQIDQQAMADLLEYLKGP